MVTSATKRSADFVGLLAQLDQAYGPRPGRASRPVVLVLDNGPIHTSRVTRKALAARPWLTVEWLPKYAPELNDIERSWRDLKRHYLAHRTFRDADDLDTAIHAAWALTQSGFSNSLAEAMAALPGGAAAFLAVSIVAFVILGSVLEGIPAIVLFGPLLFPIAQQVGVHEVHYAMVVVLAMGIGLSAPPFGVGYYAACAIGRVNPDEGMRPIVGYILALLVGLIVVAAVPWISIGFLD